MEIFNNLGVIPKPLFDTQIAGMAAGFGEQIAYDALVRQMLRIDLDKSSRFTDWARRPLSDAQLTYALADVVPPGRALSMLRERLEKAGRLAWVEDEMADLVAPSNYDMSPQNAWKRLKVRRPHGQVPGGVQGRGRLARADRPDPATSRAAAS